MTVQPEKHQHPRTSRKPPTVQTLLREYVCACCFSRLVEKFMEGRFIVICPHHCQRGGFITQAAAERRKAESAAELEEVAHNYPELDPQLKLTPAQRTDLSRALWGED